MSPHIRTIAIYIAVAILFTTLGYGASFLVKSPAQIAADTNPPPPSQLTAPIQRGKIGQTIVADATISQITTATIPLLAPADSQRAVIDAILVKPGDALKDGSVVAQVSSRPVIVFHGQVPAFRTIQPGMSGTDVQQLQNGLTSAGYSMSDKPGLYGPSTQHAVSELYKSHGFEPVTMGVDEENSAKITLKGLERTVTDADIALKRARADAGTAPPNSQSSQPSTGERPDRDTSRRSIVDAQRTLQRAIEDREDARAQLAKIQSKAGATLPLGEISFTPRLPAIVQNLGVHVGQLVTEKSIISLGTDKLGVIVEQEQNQLKDIRVKQQAHIYDNQGHVTDGTVLSVTNIGAKNGDGKVHIRAVIQPTKDVNKKRLGETVQVRINVAPASKEEHLLVPIAAISTQADGTSFVTRVLADKTEPVMVQVVGQGDGYAAIRVLGSGRLTTEDAVVVGKP